MVFEKDKASSSAHILDLPGEDTPLVTQNHHYSSKTKTFANIFMSFIGSGVLGLPYTFRKVGWLVGSLMLFSVAFTSYHCMMLLVYARRKLESDSKSTKISSFGDLGFAVCGPIGRFAVDAMILLSQAAFCVSYLIFIANTLAYIFNRYSPSNGELKILGFSPKTVYIWSCFPLQLGLNSIPTLTHLAPLSIFADVVDIGAMGVVMVEDVLISLKNRPVLQPFGGFDVLLYGFGVSVYAFEGAAMVLPLESEMKEKQKFGKVLGISITIISVIYAVFGALGYFAFGEDTKDIITTNLGEGFLSTFVQLGLCINLVLTFPLMTNPVFEVVERRVCEGRYNLLVRWVVVLVVTLVALFVPNFADFLSLVGSSVCITLVFVLPSLFHLLVFHHHELGWIGLGLDAILVVFGVGFAVSGTWSSLLQIFAPKA